MKREKVLQDQIIIANRSRTEQSRFLAIASHEIRTPLNGILGGLKIARLEPERATEFTNLAFVAAENLKYLLDEILDLSRLQGYRPGARNHRLERIDVEGFISGVMSAHRPAAEIKSLELRCASGHHADEDANVMIAKSALLKALNNLIGNAIKFTDAGRVDVSWRYDVVVDELVVEVTDDGPGITPTKLDLIFEPFERAGSANPDGFGLGLAVVKTAVETAGGSVFVRSAPGEGSTFGIRLPVQFDRDTQTEVTSASPRPSFEASQRMLRVLVVDDVSSNRMLLKTFLARHGCVVTEAADGLEALKRCRDEASDIILLDHRMPNLDGLGFLAGLAAILPERTNWPQIFVISADASGPTAREYENFGISHYVTKPFDFDEIANLVFGTSEVVSNDR